MKVYKDIICFICNKYKRKGLRAYDIKTKIDAFFCKECFEKYLKAKQNKKRR